MRQFRKNHIVTRWQRTFRDLSVSAGRTGVVGKITDSFRGPFFKYTTAGNWIQLQLIRPWSSHLEYGSKGYRRFCHIDEQRTWSDWSLLAFLDNLWNRIEVLIHPQSLIHSMVQFFWRSIKAQMGIPWYATSHSFMRWVIQRLAFPDAKELSPFLLYGIPQTAVWTVPMSGIGLSSHETGRKYSLCPECCKRSGSWCFLNNKLSFTTIPKMISKTLEAVSRIPDPIILNWKIRTGSGQQVAQNLLTSYWFYGSIDKNCPGDPGFVF